ncbi:hypothetical protein IWW34DRAFT_812431 [Fusarium oxysporum f. sp. albedinis]|nr:hypothetical protein IWW34DRAFT_812431 [Fusarium oxysporum f. sp. albedinis]
MAYQTHDEPSPNYRSLYSTGLQAPKNPNDFDSVNHGDHFSTSGVTSGYISTVSYPQHDQQLTTYGQPPLQHLQQPMYYLLQNQHQSTPPHALNSLYFQGDPCSGHLIAPQTTTVSPEAGPQQPVSQHKHHLCRETAVDILPIYVTTPLSKSLSPELFPMHPGNSTPDINPSMAHGPMPAATHLAVLRGNNSVPWITF